VADVNAKLLERKIIGGLALGRHYPELGNAALVCATEMTKRAEMDAFAEIFAQ
jgi:glycine dehydrogenase subunit 1